MKKKYWLAGAASAAGVLAVLAGGTGFFFEMAFPRKPRFTLPASPKEMTDFQKECEQRIQDGMEWMKEKGTEKLFISSYDGLRLKATFLPAAEESTRTILAVHGYRNYGEREYAAMARFYYEMGYNVLIVDDRGHGESSGDYVGYGWQDHYDVESWIQYLIQRFGENSEIFLYGISMGAATVMIAAGDPQPPQVKGIIADCGYTSIIDQFKYMMKKEYRLPSFPLLWMTRKLAIHRAGYDIKKCDAKKALEQAELPILFIHGKEDDFVPTFMSEENYEACASEYKELLLMEGAGHAKCYFVDTELYEETVREFLDQWGTDDETD